LLGADGSHWEIGGAGIVFLTGIENPEQRLERHFFCVFFIGRLI
jgi:hypothetical protein